MATTFSADGITLEKVRDSVWEIPREGDMRVPARVLASEALLEEIADDLTLTQLKNTTHLPGIQEPAICMPDGHQGYGFPVGGVAGIDANDGCISPGAVGYDINCHPYDTNILLQFGRRRKIGDLVDDFEEEHAIVSADGPISSEIRLYTESEAQQLYEVETITGDTVQATPDHPFLTPDGMVELRDLEPGDIVFVRPFVGIPDEEPEEFVVLSESDFQDEDPQLVSYLKSQGLLPLKSTDEAFNRLLKIVGFHSGDGTFRGKQTWFYGEPVDLEQIRNDILEIGFKPSRIYSRERQHNIDGNEFETTEHSFKVGAHGFKQLISRLGAPEGKKVESGFRTPEFLDRLANWQRALYLSGFFGAEMSAPSAQFHMNLHCPKISQNRVAEKADMGEKFMREIAEYLEDLGIETNRVERFDTGSESGRMERIRLGIKNDSATLIRFLTTVGYRYSRSKQKKAILAAQYLKYKERTIENREQAAQKAAVLADGGMSIREIMDEIKLPEHFVRRSVRGDVKTRHRPPGDFPGFDEFCENAHVRDNLTVQAEIESITETGREPVYDIGVEHAAHNFVANGFVVSNCGVRMMRTDLRYDDVQGREEELVDALFDVIPSGLGKGGVVESTVEAVDAILDRGMDWALEQGYAVPEDLEHCEDEGVRTESDPAKVSHEAKQRGKNQIGSLGSGNHFLEIQRVTDVFLDDAAADFGLEEDQIVILIHCGSRGLGHQTCNDYLRRIEQTHAGLLAQLPDKELAAAPAGSQLAEDYYQAMGAAINFAWVNRQLVMHGVRQVFEAVFERDWRAMDLHLLYDVAHNIAKKEVHTVDGEERELFVHRKGATRAFPAGRPEIPRAYADVGQPILIPGSMGAGSYILRGGAESMNLTFGSTAHGAGRLMSRTQAKNTYWGEDVRDELQEGQQVYVKAQSGATIAEEAPGVYKDVDEVVRVSDELGIGDKVARTFPVANVKG
jgi:tRNA-splicing ligase RtcB